MLIINTLVRKKRKMSCRVQQCDFKSLFLKILKNVCAFSFYTILKVKHTKSASRNRRARNIVRARNRRLNLVFFAAIYHPKRLHVINSHKQNNERQTK